MKEESNEMTADALKVKIFANRMLMGKEAAGDVARKINELLKKQDFVNVIFAAAPSQNEFLDALSKAEEVDWKRVNAFHMDEYLGLEKNHPERFGNFLRQRIFERVPLHNIYYLNDHGLDPEAESLRYAFILDRYPADVVCMGIGENAHIAFNDPHVADFQDPFFVKTVCLDQTSRWQQVHDACFADISDVPTDAITLTIPALMRAPFIYCMVPGRNKAEAVYHTIHHAVEEKYPSTILREHRHAVLYLDRESASLLV